MAVSTTANKRGCPNIRDSSAGIYVGLFRAYIVFRASQRWRTFWES